MLRRAFIQLIAALLVVVPMLGVFAKTSSAAETSRVAIVKSMSGDVNVQKAGGSRSFRAFTKLSLNQGDILTTGDKSSAVLQFSNGTSEDDLMTVAANSTLKFSKLSNKKGSVTKVSMLKGSVWSDVKSIQNKDDEFQLETPTAIMGVRGTNFLAIVNPVTNASNVSVFAGVVQLNLSSFIEAGAGTSLMGLSELAKNGKIVYLYPAEQINVSGGQRQLDDAVIINVASLVQMASPEIIQAILESAAKIQKENADNLKKLQSQDQGKGSSYGATEQTLKQLGDNMQALLGTIVNEAVSQNKLDAAKVDELIKKAESLSGMKIDLSGKSLELTEEQKRKQAAEAAKQKQEEEAALKAQQQKIEDLKKLLENQLEALKQQQAKNNQANRDKKAAESQQAEEAYKSKLTDAQKQAYEKAKQENGTASQSPSPSTGGGSTPSRSRDSTLRSLSLSQGTLDPGFSAQTLFYDASVGSSVAELAVTPVANDSNATVKVNGTALTGASRTVTLAYGSNTITVEVRAQDLTTTSTYEVTVTRQLMNSVSIQTGAGSPLNIDFVSGASSQSITVPSDASSLVLTVPSGGPALTVKVNGTTVQPVAGSGLAMVPLAALVEPTFYTYTIPLSENSNVIELSAVIDEVTKTYKVTVNKDISGSGNHAPTAIALSPSVLTDESATGSMAGTLSATDADAGDTFTFALVSGDGATDNSKFTIDGSTLKTAAVLAANTYHIRVKVTDAGGLTYESMLAITVTHVNHAPTAITLNAANVTDESTSGSPAGTLSAADADPNDTFTYALVSGSGATDNGKFTISGSTLKTASVLAAGTYHIRVKVTDAGGLTYESVLAITVIHVNHAPTAITLNAANVTDESTSGSPAGTLSAADSDPNDTFTFALVSGDGATDNSKFTIDGSTLKTAAVLAANTYHIRVKVTDAGGLTYESVLAITVTHVNHAPTAITLNAANVTDESASGSVAGQLSATDVDPNDTFTYELVEGQVSSDNGKFTIDGSTLKTAAVLAAGTYHIRVKVTDAGGLTYESELTVTVGHVDSHDATLSGIVLSGGAALNEIFDPERLNYTANVGYEVGEMTLNPTTTSSAATMTVNGQLSIPTITLSYGSNEITIVVTAEDGMTTKTYTVVITRGTQTLETPTGLAFTGGVATWNAVPNENGGYRIQLYKSGAAIGSPIDIAHGEDRQHEFFNAIDAEGPGSYTFKVKALGINVAINGYLDSAEAESGEYVLDGKLAKPNQLTLTNGVAQWSSVLHNSGYQLQLYKDGAAYGDAVTITIDPGAAPSYDFSDAIDAGGAGSYTFKVKAIGALPYTDSDESEASNAQTVAHVDVPEYLTAWSGTTDLGEPLGWQYTGTSGEALKYGVHVAGASTKFKLLLHFDSSKYDEVTITGMETQQTERYSADGEEKTFDLASDSAYTTFSVTFVQKNQSGQPTDLLVLTVLRGDPILSDEQVRVYPDGYEGPPLETAQMSADEFFVNVDQSVDAINLLANPNADGDFDVARDGVTLQNHTGIELSAGMNAFVIKIKDRSGVFSLNYTLYVYRGVQPQGLALSALEAQGGTVPWNEALGEYDIRAGLGQPSLTGLRAIAASGTSVKFYADDGVLTDSGNGMYAVSLLSDQTIVNVVTDNGSDKWVYRIVIQRMQLPAGITGMSLRSSDESEIKLTYVYSDRDDKVYFGLTDQSVAELHFDIDETVQSIEVTPIMSDANSTFVDESGTIPLLLGEGYNSFEIAVETNSGEETSETEYFTLDIVKGTMPLADLSIRESYYQPAGEVAKIDESTYRASTSYTELNVVPEAYHWGYYDHFRYSVNGGNPTTDNHVTLTPNGWNEVVITSYDYGGALTTDYHLWIWQGAEGPAKLSSLGVTNQELSPAFDPAVEEYSVSVPNDQAAIGLFYETADPDAGVTILLNGTSAGVNGGSVTLGEGDNVVTLEVSSRFGVTKTYTITVQKSPAATEWPSGIESVSATLNGEELSWTRVTQVPALDDMGRESYRYTSFIPADSTGTFNWSLLLNVGAYVGNASLYFNGASQEYREDTGFELVNGNLHDGYNLVTAAYTMLPVQGANPRPINVDWVIYKGTRPDTNYMPSLAYLNAYPYMSESSLELNDDGEGYTATLEPGTEAIHLLADPADPRGFVQVFQGNTIFQRDESGYFFINGLTEGANEITVRVYNPTGDTYSDYRLRLTVSSDDNGGNPGGSVGQLPPGVAQWKTKLHGSTVNWHLNEADSDALEWHYEMQIDELPEEMGDFVVALNFDRGVTDAQLHAYGQDSDLEGSNTLPFSFTHPGRNDASVTYTYGGESYTVDLTVYVGGVSSVTGSWNLGNVSVPFYKAGYRSYWAYLPDVSGSLTINAQLSDVYTGFDGEQEVWVNGEKQANSGFSNIIFTPHQGWNTVLLKRYDVDDNLIDLYTLGVYVGESNSSVMGLASLTGTDSNSAPVVLQAMGVASWMWQGQLTGSPSFVKLVPQPAPDFRINGVWIGDGDFRTGQWLTPVNGAYTIPIMMGYGYAIIVLQRGSQLVTAQVLVSSQTETVPFEPDLSLQLSYTKDSQPNTTQAFYRFGDSYWVTLPADGTDLAIQIASGDKPNYSYELIGSGQETFSPTELGALDAYDNRFTLTVTDSLTRETAAFELHLLRSGSGLDTLSVGDVRLNYGNDATTSFSESTEGFWSYWSAELPEGTTVATLSIPSSARATIRDTMGNEVGMSLQGGTVILYIDEDDAVAGHTAEYLLLLEDEHGNQYPYPLRLAFVEAAPKFDMAASTVTGTSIGVSWTTTGNQRYYTELYGDEPDIYPDSISLGFNPYSGYRLAYEASEGEVNADGMWSGLEPGRNKLTVTVYDGDDVASSSDVRTYSFYAYLLDPMLSFTEDGSEGMPNQQYGAKLDGEYYYMIPDDSAGLTLYLGDETDAAFTMNVPSDQIANSRWNGTFEYTDTETGASLRVPLHVQLGDFQTTTGVSFGENEPQTGTSLLYLPGSSFSGQSESFDLRVQDTASRELLQVYLYDENGTLIEASSSGNGTWLWSSLTMGSQHFDRWLKVKLKLSDQTVVYFVRVWPGPA